ncbi:MAG: hypothetical protein HYU51_15655 [Candidatus Rokubacteria bacterium]|nr:hypothetical protein [Candidatus Rokubacteria bacterium]
MAAGVLITILEGLEETRAAAAIAGMGWAFVRAVRKSVPDVARPEAPEHVTRVS